MNYAVNAVQSHTLSFSAHRTFSLTYDVRERLGTLGNPKSKMPMVLIQ